MDKFLYFAQGDGANATSRASLYPLSSFRGFDPSTTTTLTLFFAPIAITDVGATDVVDKVVLTISTNTHKKVMQDICKAINAQGIGLGDGFIVIADEDNGIFCSSDISEVETTLAA